jgi:hypothetical protein
MQVLTSDAWPKEEGVFRKYSQDHMRVCIHPTPSYHSLITIHHTQIHDTASKAS